MKHRSHTALTALLAVCTWLPLTAQSQSGDCERSVVVDSAAPELRTELHSLLAAHGLDVVSSASGSVCGVFSVAIATDDTGQYLITLRDSDGHSSFRALRDIGTVITLVESWARPNAADALGLLFPDPPPPEAVAAEGSSIPAVAPSLPDEAVSAEGSSIPAVASSPPDGAAEAAAVEPSIVNTPDMTQTPADSTAEEGLQGPVIDVLPLLSPRLLSALPAFSAAFAQSGPRLSQAGLNTRACMGQRRFCAGYDGTFVAGPASSLMSTPALTAWLHADLALVSRWRQTLIVSGMGLGVRWMSASAVFSRLSRPAQQTLADAARAAPPDTDEPVTPVPDPGGEPDEPGPEPEEPENEGAGNPEEEAEQKAARDDPSIGRVSDAFALSSQLFVHFDIPVSQRLAITPGAAFVIAPVSNSIPAYRPAGLDWSVMMWVGLRPGRHR
ncbi:MAG: hypothetical protein KGO50_02905 [Myxococcales bacterium]|nr:hypothetical protein [Myxococcales bacterium]